MTTEREKIEQDLARRAIDAQIAFNNAKDSLDALKEELREIANNDKIQIIVENHGTVSVSVPYPGKETTVLVFDHDKLNQLPDIKKKLIEKGIAVEEIKKVPASSAKVTIKPNV